uniref:Uncharacterized protein n=1 Tax=Meloidogyne javanica TaxID=6303 RepID=A0A915MIP6_MELJA
MTGTDPNDRLPRRMLIDPDEIVEHHDSSKTNSQQFFADVNRILGTMDIILEGIKKSVDDELLSIFGNEEIRLRPTTFNPIDPTHVEQLTRMGIRMEFQPDGRIQLIHTSSQ